MGAYIYDLDRYDLAVKLVAFAIKEEFGIELGDEQKEAIKSAIYEQTKAAHNAG